MPKHPKQPQIYEVLLDAMQDALNNPQKDPAQMAAEYQDEIDQVVSE
jgi:maltose-binding protein MalE